MIGYIKGIVTGESSDYIVLESRDIGYQIHVANPTTFIAEKLLTVYIHQVIREDAHMLYGFLDQVERDFFRLLLSVSGVGPKAALNMLNSKRLYDIIPAIRNEDIMSLTMVPGIGKKTAQRIVLDLKDKCKLFAVADVNNSPSPGRTDVIEALLGLGYTEEECHLALNEVVGSGESLDTEELLKRSLQYLGLKV